MSGVRTIFGIDFSGAKDAGNKIWLGKGCLPSIVVNVEALTGQRRELA
jgi:hypothetical protein